MIPSTFGIKKETIIYAAIALIGLLIIIQILRKVGLFSSKEKRELKAAKAQSKREKLVTKTLVQRADIFLRNNSGFDLNYWKNYPNSLLDPQMAQDYAKTLRKSMKGFGTKESTLIGVFQNLKNLAQISQVANEYFKKYERSLIADIISELKDSEEYDLYLLIKDFPKS